MHEKYCRKWSRKLEIHKEEISNPKAPKSVANLFSLAFVCDSAWPAAMSSLMLLYIGSWALDDDVTTSGAADVTDVAVSGSSSAYAAGNQPSLPANTPPSQPSSASDWSGLIYKQTNKQAVHKLLTKRGCFRWICVIFMFTAAQQQKILNTWLTITNTTQILW